MLHELKNEERGRLFVCPHCKTSSDTIGITRSESCDYIINLQTGQWEDFGEEDVESQKYFCVQCEKNVRFVE